MGTGPMPGSFDENRGAARSRCCRTQSPCLTRNQATLRIARLPGLLASPSLSPERPVRPRADEGLDLGVRGWYVADGSYSARISLILQCVTGGRCAPQSRRRGALLWRAALARAEADPQSAAGYVSGLGEARRARMVAGAQ